MLNGKLVFYFILALPLLFLYNNCSGEFSSIDTKTNNLTENSIVNEGTSANNESEVTLKESTDSLIHKNKFMFKDIRQEAITNTDATISWTLSEYAQSQIKFGVTEELTQSNQEEVSFQYKTHRQNLTNLTPNTIYFFKIYSTNREGEKIVSTLQQFKTNASLGETKEQEILPVPSPNDAMASKLWLSKGYSLFFATSPSEADINKDPKNYFEKKWNNGHSLNRYIANTLDISKAPDGSPAARISVKKGGGGVQVSIMGNQFGAKGPEAQVVWSVETYFECYNGKMPKGIGYAGHGHHWASEDNINQMPGGSVNFDNSWSMRVPMSKSGYYYVYAYIPDKTTVYGRSFGVIDPKPNCGRWEKMELEVIQNFPVTAKNGIVRLYLNDRMILEQKNLQIRKKTTVRPKGLGYFMQTQKSSETPATHIYHRNWKIYTK